MDHAPSLITLPLEVLHHIFRYLTFGQPSNHLATGQVDASFRGLMFACHSLHALTSEYYYNHKIFKCTASDLVWELIHMNPDPRAAQAFSSCIERIQRLEVNIHFFGTIDGRDPYPSGKLEKIDLQIADLESLRSCLEHCKTSPTMKSLVLVSTGRKNEEEYVVKPFSKAPITERSMYAAVFSSFENRVCTLNLEHRPPKRDLLS